MNYFEKYSSNTIAGSSNQLIFSSNTDTSRVFYKVTNAGEYNYSFLFTNTIDSTYANGAVCQKNVVCSEWEILGARATVVSGEALNVNLTSAEGATELNGKIDGFKELLFDGKSTRTVAPAEIFSSDEITLNAREGDYVCVELTYKGEVLPYHEEIIIPVYRKTDTGWEYNKKMPVPSMVGIDKSFKAKIGFIGDSITQGIGVPLNHYTHWNAVLANALGNDYAYWNLGIGFGRANDIATLGAWFNKALKNDILVVCYGVNDIMQGFSMEQVKNDIETTVTALKKAGKTVVLQTVPPFNYNPEQRARWEGVNDYIKNTLSDVVDLVFDTVPHLGVSMDEPHMAKYGGHPNEEGCAIWGKALYEAVKSIIK